MQKRHIENKMAALESERSFHNFGVCQPAQKKHPTQNEEYLT
jgi:hypothetical protein